MKILFVSAEAAPFSKTGGLADVANALPRALKDVSGCDVRVISPFYKMVKEGGFGIKKTGDIKEVPGFEEIPPFELLEGADGGVTFYFVGRSEYYDRDGLYGTTQGDYPDNADRFSFFCRAVLAAAISIGFFPDIIHINDWQTGLIPLYKDTKLKDGHTLRNSRVLLTIHNLAYEGRFEKDKLGKIGLPEDLIESLRCQAKFSFIKSGITRSDAVNTVSKKYAEEILTPEYGNGMNNIFIGRKKEVHGILNGVDYSSWDPATDALISVNYDAGTLEKKLECKAALLERMKMNISIETPLLGSIGRLAWQKGVDIMADSIGAILDSGAGFVLLGAGEERYEEGLKRISREHDGMAGIHIGFDNRLAHMIEAGADIFVMPSRYEPCGLNQMYSLRYGTIPVVRATGGLDDTITDYSEDRKNANGFKFSKAEAEDFTGAVKRAIGVFNDKKEWLRLQKKGMAADFSWKRAAREYIALYEKMTSQI